jgi:hypothetical protein
MNEQKKERYNSLFNVDHYKVLTMDDGRRTINPLPKVTSPETVRRLLNAQVKVRLLHAAVELDLLARLREQPHTAVSLSDRLGVMQRGVEVLLAGLSGLAVVGHPIR